MISLTRRLRRFRPSSIGEFAVAPVLFTAIGALFLALLFTASPSPALGAEWLNDPGSADWNTDANWSPANAPNGRGETATFGTSVQTSLTVSGDVFIDSITFNPGASAFSINNNQSFPEGRVEVHGVGIVNDSGKTQTFINSGPASHMVFCQFTGNAVGSTAADATIVNSGDVSFTAIIHGASGGNAALINANPTAFITIAELDSAGTTLGSIAGNGAIFLGSKNLTVGGNQQSTIFSGVISDGRNLPFLTQDVLDEIATQPSYTGGSLTKVGAGTLTLTGTNTYSGITTINGGVLSISQDANLGTPPGETPGPVANQLTFNGGTLQATASFALNDNRGITLLAGGGTIGVTGANVLTYGGVIAGAGSLTKSATGTLILSGANTYSGITAINAGVLSISQDANLGTPPGTPVGNQLTFNGGTLQATSSFTLNPNRGITLNAGGGTFDVAGANVLTYGGVISGPGNLTKVGTGTLGLSGSNTYAGATLVSGGTLQAGSASALSPNSGFTVNSRLDLNGFSNTIGSLTGNGIVTNSGRGGFATLSIGNDNTNTAFSGILQDGSINRLGLTKVGTGTLTLTGTSTYTGGTIINAGTLQLGNGGTTGSIAGDVVNNGILAFNRSNSFTFGGAISGIGSVQQIGSGTLALAGNNTYAGGTTIAGGTILTQNASALGTGPVTFGNGAALQVQNILNLNGNWMVFSGTASVSGGTVQTFGDFNLGGSGTLIVNSGFNVPGTANINSSGFVVNSAFTANDDINLKGSAAAVINGLLTSASVNVNNTSSLIVNALGSVAANVNVGPSALLALFGVIKGVVVNGGSFQGTGVVEGNVVNSGTVSPGASIGRLTINGNYTQSPSGTLRIEVAGASPGQYDGACGERARQSGWQAAARSLGKLHSPGGRSDYVPDRRQRG